jgi:hypothetical protein
MVCIIVDAEIVGKAVNEDEDEARQQDGQPQRKARSSQNIEPAMAAAPIEQLCITTSTIS